jgi:hypothetical protein
MISRRAFARVLPAAVTVVLACALAGCSGGSGQGGSGQGGSGGTGLDAALANVASTPVTRAQVAYDDTAALVKLSGVTTNPGTGKGFAVVLGWGASSLVELAVPLPGDTGINVLKEDYAISAGNPPQTVTLLHGGQSASLVTSRLGKLGWKQDNGVLVGPPGLGGGSAATAQYALQMHEVRADGSDVRLGQSGVSSGQLGSPSGPTLASDPLISALAGCLGDVVAAQVQAAGQLGGRNPAAVAVGVRRPASDTATPHAVVCVAWSSQAGATQYTADARKALSSGTSFATKQPYSDLLSHASVTSIGGSQNIVQWQADTPRRADQVFQMYLNQDLPALQSCARLPKAAQSRAIGCP